MKRLAVIVPYRDRKEHLEEFVPALFSYLREHHKLMTLSKPFQFAIFVIEQGNDKPFNRGMVINCGFALTKDEYDYFCFHDVDMVPTMADYSYVYIPTHLAADVEQFRGWEGKGFEPPTDFEDYAKNFKHWVSLRMQLAIDIQQCKNWVEEGLAYPSFFGGVVLFNKADFLKVNGYSNGYWGYGVEDDDLLWRVYQQHLPWTRRHGVFRSLHHKKNYSGEDHHANMERNAKIQTGELIDDSGLSDLAFTLKVKETFPEYTFYSVDF